MKFVKFIFVLIASLMCACSDSSKKLPELSKDENPLILMFAIAGKPDNDFLKNRLEGFKNAGITQFLIYPRSGCQFNYMKDDWLSAVKFMIDEAKRLNFSSVWLYDEFNWPSGTANKQVMKINPEYGLHHLSAVKQADGSIGFEIVVKDDVADLLNDAPVDLFISMTHEKYYELFKEDFGGIIKGIFTDEPGVGYFSKDKKYIRSIPYYKGLEEDYKKATSRDLRADMLAAIKTNTDIYHAPVAKLVGARMKKHYTKKISDWAKSHGILATGHLLFEDTPRRSMLSCGHILDVLDGLSFPAIDEIYTHKDVRSFEWLTFGSAMYAIEKNGRGGLAELFALGPCDTLLSTYRRQIWLASAFGVNRYLLAISQTDLRQKGTDDIYAGGMSSWLSSFSTSQPWFEKISVLAEDAKNAARFSEKEKSPLVSVVYPYEVVDMNLLLVALVEKQISWKLVKENEQVKTKYRLHLSKNGIECKNATGKTLQDIIDCIDKQECNRALIAEKSDLLAKDIFIQHYKDGSFLAVNFTDKKRELVLQRNGKKIDIVMQPMGILALEKDENPKQVSNKIISASQPQWDIEINRPNTLRPSFVKSDTFEFSTTENMKLSFAIRNHGRAVELSLDGKKLNGSKLCEVLPDGFKNLYRQVDVNISAGKHSLKLENNAIDGAYSPIVCITGCFSENQNILSRYKNNGYGLNGYVGKIKQTTNITIPPNATSIEFNTQGMVSELFIDGKSYGTKMWYPFRWDIPKNINGKNVEVKLVRFTSMARCFGKRVEDYIKGDISSLNWAYDMAKNFFPKQNKIPLSPYAEMVFFE